MIYQKCFGCCTLHLDIMFLTISLRPSTFDLSRHRKVQVHLAAYDAQWQVVMHVLRPPFNVYYQPRYLGRGSWRIVGRPCVTSVQGFSPCDGQTIDRSIRLSVNEDLRGPARGNHLCIGSLWELGPWAPLAIKCTQELFKSSPSNILSIREKRKIPLS